ncbi:hypothetical protein [Sinorhizobium medicae]|uniref:hypothetical protein n=1 Tax=Sinorhizobium medicae TaxID=110321 RepID=UPI001F36943E|nr:hypothetical protein [Sinorhizobium medicae]
MQSTYSAMEGDGIGDLTVLYKFERLAEAGGIPAAINRAAEMLLESARQCMIPTRRPERLPDFVINGRCKAPAAAQDQNCRTGCVCAAPEALDQSLPARRWHGKLLPRRLGGGYGKQRNDEGGNSDFE